MVVGNGMIAKAFIDLIDDDKFLIFASGVSNSKETRVSEFEREENLVKKYLKDYPQMVFVYFSTCSVYDPEEFHSPYVQHKLKLESFIKNSIQEFLILRVSNVVGNTDNVSIIFNYLVHHIINRIHFNVWKNAYRNLIDIDDVKLLVLSLIQQGVRNKIINIANPINVAVLDIVHAIEHHLKLRGSYTLIEKGSNFCIDCGEIETLGNKIRVNFFEDYISLLLKKYYQHVNEQYTG